MTRSIEIKTAHNIVVHFDLAPLGDRIMAVIIDLVIACVAALVIGGLIASIGVGAVGLGVGLLILGLYHLGFEVFNAGQSPGKRLLNIKVVNLKGIPPNAGEAFQRWVFRAVDVTFSTGAIASLFIASSPKNQRIGDLIAGCTVIKIKKTNDISLDRIRRIQERRRDIKYPSVDRYSEQDMLVVKEVLGRHSKLKNTSTRRALHQLAKRIGDDLKLPLTRVDHVTFLEDVLKDYVSLTR